MANRTRAAYEAPRLARWVLADVARELRIARIRGGLRQADVARVLGTSKSRVSRVEHGLVPTLTLVALTKHAAAVGLKPSVRLYPLGRRLLDGPQIDLLARFRARLSSAWHWETEVPVPLAGDLRSADARISVPGCAIVVEAFTRLADFQAQTAAAARKKRDLGADRLVIVCAATNANRRAVAEATGVLGGALAIRTRSTLEALADGEDPRADAIVFL